ncbi:DUF1573 domain-containing protein [Opitutus sp. ER46]|uniref:DUF1573 domain-containing protein n=1 Tax=Opitutus sp. ER46 TaxID=2161864 RepID=UPI000D311742|nr:DUF1573 domain-containing protein [Opitutus sp. ER46]PTX94189.1 hypothetical protein DB354_10500 [Opitutus sp. ER46]
MARPTCHFPTFKPATAASAYLPLSNLHVPRLAPHLSLRGLACACIAFFVTLLPADAPAASEPAVPAPAAGAVSSTPHPLVWDAMEQVLTLAPGQTTADFQFTVVNASDAVVTIREVRPTCHCTVPSLPALPWRLEPGASGSFSGELNVRGMDGKVTKAIYVDSTAGTQVLRVTATIPVVEEAARRRHREIARADRQAVFRGDCVSCHVTPATGLSGGQLFLAACGVCHFATRRDPAVPDLLTARQHRDDAYWRRWITEGRPGTMMPGWSKAQGGPLTDEQIESLIQFALRTLPTAPRVEDKG